MKFLPLLLIFSIIIDANAQQKVAGEYFDYFGNTLELNSDSTFKHIWRFDLASSWTKGKWRIKDDTVFLDAILIYDTLKYQNKTKLDSLVLSSDDKSETISDEEFALSLILSGGQNRQTIPTKLYFRKGRLYKFDKDGRLKKKKIYGNMARKYFPPYYERKNNNLGTTTE